MVRKLRQLDIAQALGLSTSMTSRYARAGMPVHSVELARKWYDEHVSPALRKDARIASSSPAHAVQSPAPLLGQALVELLLDAREEIVAALVAEGLVTIEAGALAVNCLACALDSALDRRGLDTADVWAIEGPDVKDGATRERIEQRAGELKAAAA